MDLLKQVFTNPFLLTGISAWFVAQVMKMIINSIINKKFSLGWLFSDGGMPSGHSATVSSLALFTLLERGASSFEFAVAMILAIIVCHDATGVRQETGKQAVLLKEIIKTFEILASKKLPEMKLKEYVGHTPVQVFAGISVGVIMALVMHFLVL